METKTCNICGETKPLEMFVKNKHCRNGRERRCQKCANAMNRAYRSSPKGQESQRRAVRAWNQANPEAVRRKMDRAVTAFSSKEPLAYKAQRMVNRAVKKGLIPHVNTQACCRCGEVANQYHHHLGYAPEHWLHVLPVCFRCHRLIHFELNKKDEPESI
jgi:hypothetical protein